MVSSSTPRPSSQQADSQATTPPPMTAIRRGIDVHVGRVAGRPRQGFPQAGDVRDGRGGAGGDDHRVPGDQGSRPAVGADDLDRLLPGQPAVALDDVDAGVVGPRHLAGLVVIVGERVPAAQHRRGVDAVIADDAGHPGHVPGRLEHLDRSQQRLARHARPVRTLAAEQFVLDDHRGPVAALDGVLRGDLAGRPTADDDHVVGVTFRRYRFGLGHDSNGSCGAGQPRGRLRFRVDHHVRRSAADFSLLDGRVTVHIVVRQEMPASAERTFDLIHDYAPAAQLGHDAAQRRDRGRRTARAAVPSRSARPAGCSVVIPSAPGTSRFSGRSWRRSSWRARRRSSHPGPRRSGTNRCRAMTIDRSRPTR